MRFYIMKIKKRNGSIVEFDWHKIVNAVRKAFNACNEDQKDYPFLIAERVQKDLANQKVETVTVDLVQNKVEEALIDFVADGLPFIVAKKYILYRDRRDKDRESINKLATTFHDIINIEDNNIKKSNANIDGNTPAGQMMIFGAESSKEHASTFIINPKYVQAHKDSYIHIHDLDYYSTKAVNCNQIDLVDLFSHDYIYTNDSIMRKPKRIASYSALAAIALQSEQNEMFGG